MIAARVALAGLVVLLGLLGLAAAARPAAADPAPLAKKDRERADKAMRRGPPGLIGARPAKLINLHNTWTNEWLAIAPGEQPPQDTVDRFLRDHYTNAPNAMDPALVDMLLAAARAHRSDVVMVVSAFRHPKYNLLLRKKGHQVARDSNHTKGHAVDFYLPRVATRTLHAWAVAQKRGGVGLYLGSGFIHMDTGPVRYWGGE